MSFDLHWTLEKLGCALTCLISVNRRKVPHNHASIFSCDSWSLSNSTWREVGFFSGGRIRSCDSCNKHAWKTFVLTVEHPYIVRKLEKSLNMGELTLHTMKIPCYRLWQHTKVHVLALAQQINLENCTKKQGCTSQNQTIPIMHHQIAECMHMILLYPLPRLGLGHLGSPDLDLDRLLKCFVHTSKSSSWMITNDPPIYNQL